ncbi:hypothetical protein CORC01_06709, partial [Colletotrichum orchidophilum]
PRTCSKSHSPRWQEPDQSEQSETTPASCGTAQPIPHGQSLGFEIIMNVDSHSASTAQQQQSTATGQASGGAHETTHTAPSPQPLRHCLELCIPPPA